MAKCVANHLRALYNNNILKTVDQEQKKATVDELPGIIHLNPIIRGVSINAYMRWGGGSKSLYSVKSITGREILCENENFSYLFYVLNGIFGHVWEMSKSIGAQF